MNSFLPTRHVRDMCLYLDVENKELKESLDLRGFAIKITDSDPKDFKDLDIYLRKYNKPNETFLFEFSFTMLPMLLAKVFHQGELIWVQEEINIWELYDILESQAASPDKYLENLIFQFHSMGLINFDLLNPSREFVKRAMKEICNCEPENPMQYCMVCETKLVLEDKNFPKYAPFLNRKQSKHDQ